MQVEREPLDLDVGVGGNQPRVVARRGKQVARGQVGGLDPLGPGHPGRGEERAAAREQHDVVDGDLVDAVGTGHRDGPAPPDVGRLGGRERVRDHPFVVGLDPQVLANDGSTGDLDGYRAGEVHGSGAQLVELHVGLELGGGGVGDGVLLDIGDRDVRDRDIRDRDVRDRNTGDGYVGGRGNDNIRCGNGDAAGVVTGGLGRVGGRFPGLVARSSQSAGYRLTDAPQHASHPWHSTSLPPGRLGRTRGCVPSTLHCLHRTDLELR